MAKDILYIMPSQTIQRGQPVEGIAEILPYQGEWSESEFLKLIDRRHVEFTDGDIEILPMPTTKHQRILSFLFRLLFALSQSSHPGEVLPAGVKLQVRPRKIREPDLIYVFASHAADLIGEQFWTGADLVVEVVSPDNPERDHQQKRIDYAEGHVPEYWIVDPQQQTFTVLTLQGDAYIDHGVFRSGDTATSPLLNGVTIDVAACFAAASPK